MIATSETKSDDNLNDSTLAKLLQEEENETQGIATINQSDEELAYKLHKENIEKQEALQFQALQEKYGMNSKGGGYSKQYEKHLQKQVAKDKNMSNYFDKKAAAFHSLIEGDDDGKTKTTGLIDCISQYYSKLSSKDRKILLCQSCDHYSSDIGDAGWGCGFRNLQMCLSALLKSTVYQKLVEDKLQSNKVPTIPKLQALIEKSWSFGYDAAGSEQLNGKLQGTRKWIGTTEITAVLRWMKIRARIVDFYKPTGTNKTHPKLFQWIYQYFEDKRNDVFPLYMQHQGHSRTCVGVEKNLSDGSLALLLFDPSHAKSKIRNLHTTLQKPETTGVSKLSIIRKSLNQIKYDQLQLLFIDGIYDSETEIQESKVITSIRIP